MYFLRLISGLVVSVLLAQSASAGITLAEGVIEPTTGTGMAVESVGNTP